MAYNGWPNYETWNVMLWLDNDEGLYRYYVDAVRDLARRGIKRIAAHEAKSIADAAFGAHATPDGVRLDSSKIRWGSIAESMREAL